MLTSTAVVPRYYLSRISLRTISLDQKFEVDVFRCWCFEIISFDKEVLSSVEEVFDIFRKA